MNTLIHDQFYKYTTRLSPNIICIDELTESNNLYNANAFILYLYVTNNNLRVNALKDFL